MADIEHKNIVDPNRHQPKGIATANANDVYKATGGAADSGSWGEIIPVGGDTADEGQVFASDGAGSGTWKQSTNIHGEMFVTGNTTAASVTAAVDGTLSTDSDYIKSTIGWQEGHTSGITFNGDEMVVTVAGSYEVNLWASFEVAVTNTLIGVKYAINDTPPYSTRKILNKSKTTTDVNNLFGVGIVPNLNVGDTISIYIAADNTTDITGREVGLTMKLLHEA